MHKFTNVLRVGFILLLPVLVTCGQTPLPPAPALKPVQAPALLHHPDEKAAPRPSALESTTPPATAGVGDPAPNPPQQPVAKLVAPHQVPVNAYVVLDFAGTVSVAEPDFDIAVYPAESKSTITKLYDDKKNLLYGMFVPDKLGSYRIALIAAAPSGDGSGMVRSYAFSDVSAVEGTTPVPPDPGPITPPPLPEPGPITPPPTPVTDTYGMYAFSNSLIAKFPTTDPWQPYAPIIAGVFDKMVAQKGGFTDATKYVEATSTAYKQALGTSYGWWSNYYFDYIKTQLAKINSAGKLPSTVDAHAVVWQELSASLKEVKQPASKSASKGAAHK